MKISVCNKCNFKTKEKHSICPLCNGVMHSEVGEVNYNPNLPLKLESKNNDVKLTYICYKCKNTSSNKVCLDCNIINYLCLEYNNKRAIINKIDNLDEIFNDDEIEYILENLTEEEKYYLYHNLAISYKLIYQVDKTKAIVLFLLAILIYIVGLKVALNYTNTSIVITYFVNAFANGILSTFVVLGMWYLIDASFVEHEKAAAFVSVTCGIVQILYASILMLLALNIKLTLIYGFISIGISILLSFIISNIVRKHK